MKEALIIGAGRLGQALPAMELNRCGFAISFADNNPGVLDKLIQKGSCVAIAGEALDCIEVKGAFNLTSVPRLLEKILDDQVSLVVTAVGEPNLKDVAQKLAYPLL